MKIVFVIAGIILLTLFLLYVILSIYAAHSFVKASTHPEFDTREKRKLRNLKDGTSLGTEVWERKDFSITLKDGYVLNGDTTLNDPNKFVIFLHGHSSTREGMIKYAKIMYSLGYSIVLYDHRSHGDNLRDYCTMGKRESYDNIEVFKYIKDKYNPKEIGLYGVSMGAASALISSKYNQDINFIIADCPFASLGTMLKVACRQKKMIFFLPYLFTNIAIKLKYNFSFKDVQVKDKIISNNVPILLFQGDKDKLVTPIHQSLIKNNLSCYFESYLVKGAEHGKSLDFDEETYKNRIIDFLKEVKARKDI